jgi:hypothetical protein
MNAGFGARFRPEDFFALLAVFLRAGRFADLLADFFLPAVFFLLVVAIASLP